MTGLNKSPPGLLSFAGEWHDYMTDSTGRTDIHQQFDFRGVSELSERC
jgi:hypothetical protein